MRGAARPPRSGRRAAALTAVLALLALPAASRDLAEIRERGSLKVLVPADEQPEMFNLRGEGPAGFDRELLEGFARLHRLRLDVVPVEDFDTILPTLARGEADLATGIIDTEARRQLVDFTVEVRPARHLVVTFRPQPVVETVEQLRAQKLVAVIGGSSWAEEARAAGVGQARLLELADVAAVVEALRSGKAPAAVMSMSDFTLSARRHPGMQGGVFLGEARSAAWALGRKEAALKAALDAYLDGLRRSGGWSRAVIQYFGEDALAVLGRARK